MLRADPAEWLRETVPGWVVVLIVSATVGAVSAVVAVLLYRDVVVERERPLPVPSEG